MAKDVNMLRALYLRAKFEMPQKDIAALLSVAQPTVSRWWNEALAIGLIREQRRYTLNETGLSVELLEQVREVEPWARRLAQLQAVSTGNGVTVRSLRVFRSMEKDGDSPIDARLKRFSKQAAGALHDAIQRSTICAVASGYTISNAVDALAAAPAAAHDRTSVAPASRVRFVPVWPEDLSDPSPRISSSALAERLDDIFNSRSSSFPDSTRPPRPPSLNSVPPFMPHYFETSKFRRYLEEDFAGYRELFGSQSSGHVVGRPVIADVDMLLTSIGARNRAFGRFHELLIKHAGVTAAELAAITAGDVGGVLIPAPNCTDAQFRRIRRINSIWNGLQPEHLEQIALRSHSRESLPPPGVVIVSIESSEGGRAQALAAAIRAGLVNELIIDEQLADGLDKELRAGDPTHPRSQGAQAAKRAGARR